MAEMMGIIRVRIACSQLIEALGPQGPQGMINIGLMALSMDGSGEALGQPHLTIEPT
jgi:hypothetical protein